ncbi:hypothetical protein TSO352_01060 [Azospirillum sp. TSO35-2]|nr:hypothetical protein TSO352_01060 [Azospirillum sp. TSO35-2]
MRFSSVSRQRSAMRSVDRSARIASTSGMPATSVPPCRRPMASSQAASLFCTSSPAGSVLEAWAEQAE